MTATDAHSKPKTGRRARALLGRAVLALVAAAALTAAPGTALANYNNVAVEGIDYTDVDSVSAEGEPLYGSQIPDGAYEVNAYTSSRMCKLSNPQTGASTKAIISVSGGQITAMFNTSAAYTAIYLGTAETAGSLTNEDGTDGSAYLIGDPATGYTPHFFAISIDGLNVPFTMATYDGAKSQPEDAKWFTRTVVFTPTDEVYAAINGANQDPEPSNPDPSTDPEKQEATPTADPGANAIPAVTNATSGSGSSGGITSAAGTGDGDGTGTGDGDGVGTGSQAGAGGGVKHGKLITVRNPLDALQDSQAQGSITAQDEGFKITPGMVLGIVLAALIAAGLIGRIVKFNHDLKAQG